MRNVLVVNRDRTRIRTAFLRTWIASILAALESDSQIGVRRQRLLKSADEITLVFVSKSEIRKLNRQFRKKDRPTDILSFAPSDPGSVGELVLCLPIIREQAKTHELSFENELGYMILHGILHLLGYDHERSSTEARRMFAIQDRIFDSLRT